MDRLLLCYLSLVIHHFVLLINRLLLCYLVILCFFILFFILNNPHRLLLFSVPPRGASLPETRSVSLSDTS
jgi:hypothetical protein